MGTLGLHKMRNWLLNDILWANPSNTGGTHALIGGTPDFRNFTQV